MVYDSIITFSEPFRILSGYNAAENLFTMTFTLGIEDNEKNNDKKIKLYTSLVQYSKRHFFAIADSILD
jgi:hypothetical protein